MKPIIPNNHTLIILCGCLLAVFLFPNLDPSADNGKNIQRKPFEMPMGIGSPEDKAARDAYMFRKLKDPTTGKIPENIRSKELAFARSLPKKSAARGTTDWYLRGPFNVGGRTRALGIDVADENIILAGQVSGGMWRSIDGGSSFTKVTTPELLQSVTCIAQDTRPGKTETWYYGTGEARGNSAGHEASAHFYLGDGMFKSTDNGLTWVQLPSTVSGTPTINETFGFDLIWNIVTDPSILQEDVIYAAVRGGIFRSANGGTDWQQVLGLDLDTTVTEISFYADLVSTTNGVLYAGLSSSGSHEGIWRSTDGISWTDITPAGWPSAVNRIAIAVAPSDENKVFFVAETPGSGPTEHNFWYYEYISGDGSGSGGLWENRSANLPEGDCSGFFTFEFASYNTQSSYDICLAVKPDDPDVIFLGGTNIYRSTDAFRSDSNWTWIGGYQCDTSNLYNYLYPNHHPDQHRLLFAASDPNVIINANDGGVYKTLDNMAPTVEWISLNNGYVTGQFYTVDFEMGNVHSDMVLGGLQDNGTFLSLVNDPNDIWTHVLRGDGSFSGIPEGREYYYLSWQLSKTYKVEIDASGNTVGLTRIDPDGGGTNLFINPLILDKNDHQVMYMTTKRYIWRNHDLSAIPITNEIYDPINTNWTRINSSSIGFQQGIQISALDVSENIPDILYYGTTHGRVYRLDSSRSADPVQTNITSPEFPNDAYLNCISVDENAANRAIAVFSNYGVKSIFLTDDYGENWSDISGNLEENPDGSGVGPAVHWVDILYPDTSTIDDTLITYYAATSTGLYSTQSLAGEATVWEQEGASTIGNVVIHMVKARESDGLVALGTHGNGIYTNKPPVTLSTPAPRPKTSPMKPYPNPFGDETRLNLHLSQEQTVSFRVFDIRGKVVHEQTRYLPQGDHQFKWSGVDGSGKKVSRGVYLLSLRINGRHYSAPVIYLP